MTAAIAEARSTAGFWVRGKVLDLQLFWIKLKLRMRGTDVADLASQVTLGGKAPDRPPRFHATAALRFTDSDGTPCWGWNLEESPDLVEMWATAEPVPAAVTWLN
jgi:hypothetical protein